MFNTMSFPFSRAEEKKNPFESVNFDLISWTVWQLTQKNVRCLSNVLIKHEKITFTKMISI